MLKFDKYFFNKCTNLSFIWFEKYLSSFCRRLLSSIYPRRKNATALWSVFAYFGTKSTAFSVYRNKLVSFAANAAAHMRSAPMRSPAHMRSGIYRLGSAHPALVRPQAWGKIIIKVPLTPLPSVPITIPDKCEDSNFFVTLTDVLNHVENSTVVGRVKFCFIFAGGL